MRAVFASFTDRRACTIEGCLLINPHTAPPRQRSDTKRTLLIAGIALVCFSLASSLAFLAVRAFLIRRAIAQERQTISPYGESLLSGPLVADGPTFGPGLHVDLETPHYVFIAVHNKSDQAWNDVVAELAVYDRREHYLRQEPCKFGSLAAGETRQQSFSPTDPQDYDYHIVEYQGCPWNPQNTSDAARLSRTGDSADTERRSTCALPLYFALACC